MLSCDIGGGTSNIAISKNGKIISTSCISVGA
ncbi:MAG: ethanolamine ammonia-lyase reactivating factor EutA, partial [Deltaproteobacteria bacterium]|nr:ethanolamine ammonia-lyase reactivating factor EutA [Deltaproteobacteria bacterium]